MDDQGQSPIIGDSLAIRRLRGLIEKIAPSSLAVLIQGPTGAGKELVAEALHAQSGRRGPFVALNVCAVPDTMLEATLFGHARGAFTGAHESVPGYLADADGGTVFLDEISGLALALQPKLLRAVETRQFRPVGARADRRSDFRVIAATNDDVDALVRHGRFRADLAHRLAAIVISVPPLRDRLEDLPLLVVHFLRCAGAGGAAPVLAQDALDLLLDYDWPGNVRELRNVVEVAALLSDASLVSAEVVEAALRRGRTAPADAQDTNFERRRLVGVLEEVGWDTVAAARELGVHRVTVYRRMQRLGVVTPRARVRDAFAPVCANLRAFAANPSHNASPQSG